MPGTLDCPACGAFTADDRWCGACGLDLHSDDASHLRELIDRVAAADAEFYAMQTRRDALTAELAHRRLAARGRVIETVPTGPPRVATRPLPTPARGEWGVERVRNLLLWTGATLLALSALAFTAVAWTHLGPGGRAVLLGAFTVVSGFSASILLRRRPATSGAFTGLTIALALIDWQVARRAGAAPSLSNAAWWAIGTAVVGLLAVGLGRIAAPAPARRALALLAPGSAVLTVAAAADAAWSRALGFGLIAAALLIAEQIVGRSLSDRVVRATLRTGAGVAWFVGAVFAVAAAFGPNSFIQTFTPAAVMLVLAVASGLASSRREPASGVARVAAFFVVIETIGAGVTLASTSVGPIGMLTLAAVLGGVAIAFASSLVGIWPGAVRSAGIASAFAGVSLALSSAAVSEFGPLAWLGHAWTGRVGVRAALVVVGPHTREFHDIGWCMLAILGAIAGAAALASLPGRRASLGIGGRFAAAGLGLLAIVVAPVAAGWSAQVAGATVTAASVIVLVGSAIDCRRHPEHALPSGLLALIPAVPAAGWAALTWAGSISVLGVIVAGALLAASIGRAAVLRAAHGAVAAATTVALGVVATLAAGASRPVAGFVGALVAGCVLLAGEWLRRHTIDGVVVESVAGLAIVGAVLLALPSPVWIAGALTAMVPLLLVASVRRDRRLVYASASATAALGATWAWLAAAGVSVVEAYTLPAAVLAFGAGALAAKHGRVRSWISFGSAIVLALGPTVSLAIVRHDDGRAIAAGVAALAIVLLGAARRLQAPLVLGTIALVALAVDKLGPQAVRLPRWAMLAIAGAILLWVGTTFERRRDDVHRATRRLADLG